MNDEEVDECRRLIDESVTNPRMGFLPYGLAVKLLREIESYRATLRAACAVNYGIRTHDMDPGSEDPTGLIVEQQPWLEAEVRAQQAEDWKAQLAYNAKKRAEWESSPGRLEDQKRRERMREERSLQRRDRC